MHSITNLLNNYGYIVLVVSLMLELIAFPFPGEVLMTYCGVLVNEHKLNWILSIFMASLGAIIGVTISYLIGRFLGTRFFKRYGHYVHMDEERQRKTSEWFNRFGNRLLLITYFIPGVRHITGYFSGITEIKYRDFAINSYTGAVIWTAVFISIGKVLGPKWETYHSLIKKYLLIVSIIIGIVLILIFIYKNHRQEINQKAVSMLQIGYKVFHSFGRLKTFMVGVIFTFIAFFSLVIGLIQDFLAHEFNQFDEITKYIVNQTFDDSWNFVMSLFRLAADVKVIIFISLISLVIIIVRGKDKLHEIKFLAFTVMGGELLSFILRIVFHRTGPLGSTMNGYSKYTFPSHESLMCIIVFGFMVYVITRHFKRTWVGMISMIISIFVCLMAGVSAVYFGTEYPSDVAAGYEFGILWLTLNIILLEIFRIIPDIEDY